MKTIYIFTNGTVLRRISQRLRLEQRQQILFEVPLKDVASILIYGRTEVTTQTMHALFDSKIPLLYVRRSGALKGKIEGATGKNVMLRQLQHQYFANDDFAIPFAQALIDCKIENMQTVIEYLFHKQQGTADRCRPLIQARQRLYSCRTRDQIMGTEGRATLHYFQIYGANLPPEFRFQIRSRRPAQDPTNALLNLGYMTLLREIQSHLEAHQLDPYLGILHATQNGRPSLALDLLEEFRQGIIDLFIARILNLGQIKIDDFHNTSESGIEMTDTGLRKFFRCYEERMGNQDGDNPGLRKMLDDQVSLLKKHLTGECRYNHFKMELSPELALERQAVGSNES